MRRALLLKPLGERIFQKHEVSSDQFISFSPQEIVNNDIAQYVGDVFECRSTTTDGRAAEQYVGEIDITLCRLFSDSAHPVRPKLCPHKRRRFQFHLRDLVSGGGWRRVEVFHNVP